MRLESVFRVLFLVYCLEAGMILTVSPWTASWERMFLVVAGGALRGLAAIPWLRGAVAGFGLVHLVWAFHDLDLMLRRAPAAKSSS